MPQGKLKVKTKLPDNGKGKKKQKGSAVTKRANKPIKPKKNKFEESHKLKKMITKTVNKKVEDEIREMANVAKKAALSKAQEAVATYHKKEAKPS